MLTIFTHAALIPSQSFTCFHTTVFWVKYGRNVFRLSWTINAHFDRKELSD